MQKRNKPNNNSRDKQPTGNNINEDKEEKLTPEMVEQNKKWAKKYNRKNEYTSD